MTKEEIQHLGTLSRIKLTEEEVARFGGEISGILGYVGTINEIIADSGVTKHVGARFNIFREDVVTNPSCTYAAELLAAMPKRQGRYLVVKKILNPEN